MAITGLVGVRGAINTSGAYSDTFHVGDAILANINISMAEGSLYANNRRKEHKSKFDNGTIELGVDDLIDAVEATMLGHSTKTVGGVTAIVSKDTDKAPDLGIGFYQTVTRDGVDKYRVVVLKRVVFDEPQDNAETADNTIKMSGRTMTGKILSDSDGEWKYDATVDTTTAAEAFLDAVLGSIS